MHRAVQRPGGCVVQLSLGDRITAEGLCCLRSLRSDYMRQCIMGLLSVFCTELPSNSNAHRRGASPVLLSARRRSVRSCLPTARSGSQIRSLLRQQDCSDAAASKLKLENKKAKIDRISPHPFFLAPLFHLRNLRESSVCS